ncbi:MAG: hypothetical protein U5K37_11925 [Natrialbaceae archaeon]|nr:hypothetical protein [Natrialbaceae archaeon]
MTVYEVMLDLDPADTTPEIGTIAYDDLPAVDRDRLERLVSLEAPPDQDGVDVGVDYGSHEAVGPDSVFVPDQQYDILEYDGQQYRVSVDSRTAPEGTYEYTVTTVAGSVGAFADGIRDDVSVRPSRDSLRAERAVVAEAIDSAYFDDDDAFRSVVDRIREHEGLTVDDFYGDWLLEYEGTAYLAYVQWSTPCFKGDCREHDGHGRVRSAPRRPGSPGHNRRAAGLHRAWRPRRDRGNRGGRTTDGGTGGGLPVARGPDCSRGSTLPAGWIERRSLPA